LVVQSLTWALECDRPQRRRSVLLQVLEVDRDEGRRVKRCTHRSKFDEASSNVLVNRQDQDLSVENIIGQIKKGVSTRSSISNFCRHTAFVSQIEPKSIDEALKGEKWVEAMHEELNQFARNEVWFLVPKTSEMNIIGSNWVFRNKLDEDGVITRNKARLVAKGYNHV